MKRSIYTGLSDYSKFRLQRYHHRTREQQQRLLTPFLLMALAWAIWILIRSFQ